VIGATFDSVWGRTSLRATKTAEPMRDGALWRDNAPPVVQGAASSCRGIGGETKAALRLAAAKTTRAITRCGDRILPEFLVILVFVMRQHKERFGVFPNIIRPRTFHEKVFHRMLFDRRPILRQLADKHAVRTFVKERLGEQVLPRWYAVTKDPATIPFDELPNQFVVKPTHGSHWVRLVAHKPLLDRHELIDTCRFWLAQNYYDTSREWAYRRIEPRIVVEEFLSDGTGPVPTDYRMLVFDGRVELIATGVGQGADRRSGCYSRTWEKLRIPTRHKDAVVPRPRRLGEMIRYAEILGAGLDFVRIDMYHTAAGVYFGEAAMLPSGGLTSYPPDLDRYLGRLWKQRLR
jgi:TupA-like ATPgrasp